MKLLLLAFALITCLPLHANMVWNTQNAEIGATAGLDDEHLERLLVGALIGVQSISGIGLTKLVDSDAETLAEINRCIARQNISWMMHQLRADAVLDPKERLQNWLRSIVVERCIVPNVDELVQKQLKKSN